MNANTMGIILKVSSIKNNTIRTDLGMARNVLNRYERVMGIEENKY